MISKQLLTLPLFIFIFILGCKTAKENEFSTIKLTNPSTVDLKDKAIIIKREEIKMVGKGSSPLLLTEEGDTIPAQLDDINRDGNWDELFFVIDLAPEEETTLKLIWTEMQPQFEYRTNVSFGKRLADGQPVQPISGDTLYGNNLPKVGFTPYQTDGPAWENEKIGFRHYFDGRNSKDLFAKRQPRMVLDEVGLTDNGEVVDNYHVLEDWGRDVLSTSTSAGIGGIALMAGDSILRLGILQGDTLDNIEKTVYQTIVEGPARSILSFQFINWKPVDKTFQVEQTATIWPGMYAYQNEVEIEGLSGNELLLVGIVNNNNSNPLVELELNDKWVALITHDKQTYDKEFWLGMAVILPKEIYQGSGEAPKTGQFSNSFYGKLKVENGKPIKYFTAAGCELSDEGFKDASYFTNYVKNLAEQLSVNVKVDIN